MSFTLSTLRLRCVKYQDILDPFDNPMYFPISSLVSPELPIQQSSPADRMDGWEHKVDLDYLCKLVIQVSANHNDLNLSGLPNIIGRQLFLFKRKEFRSESPGAFPFYRELRVLFPGETPKRSCSASDFHSWHR